MSRVSAGERLEASEKACRFLIQQTIWRQATTVLLYSALGDELDITPLFADSEAAGRRIGLPCFNAARGDYEAWFISDRRRDLVAGHYGILEPAAHCRQNPVEKVDLILVPGVAFSPDGWRLGRGKGYYDRLLNRISGRRCGVAMEFQVFSELPHEAHDIAMDFLLTPGGWLECRSRAGAGN